MSGSEPHHPHSPSFTRPPHRDPPNVNHQPPAPAGHGLLAQYSRQYESLLAAHTEQLEEAPSPSASRPNSPFPSDSYHFDDAFPPSPPAPYTNFLDTILNPPDNPQTNSLPFGYTHPPLYIRSPPMSSSRPSRLPNGYVDLTSDLNDSPPIIRPAVRRRRTPTPGPSAKRQKRQDSTTVEPKSKAQSKIKSPELVEQIDMTDDKTDMLQVLQKQRADAVKSQQKPEEKATTFSNFTCVICMDSPTDITATSCGHLFCHMCLMEALIAGEARSGPNEPKRSQCPVCRKIINRNKPADIIPLMLKKGLKTQPRKSSSTVTAACAGKRVESGRVVKRTVTRPTTRQRKPPVIVIEDEPDIKDETDEEEWLV